MERRTDGRTYVCTDVYDVMAMKPNFFTSMGYRIFFAMVLRYLSYFVQSGIERIKGSVS